MKTPFDVPRLPRLRLTAVRDATRSGNTSADQLPLLANQDSPRQPGVPAGPRRDSPRGLLRDCLLPPQQAPCTPTKESLAARPGNQFLEHTMGRHDLMELAKLFNDQCQGHWAFTGSVALQMHGYDRQVEEAKNRMPADVDMMTTENGKNNLCHTATASGDDNHAGPCRGNPFHFEGDGVKVDVLTAPRNKSAVASKLGQIAWIEGVPVLSLTALRESKEIALDSAANNAETRKAQSDIALIDLLLEKPALTHTSTALLASTSPATTDTPRKFRTPANPPLGRKPPQATSMNSYYPVTKSAARGTKRTLFDD
ncbi:MAG: hypothetical protein GZ090_12180 [Oxalobacteraceae bacterium]|nr:hypothetical protein [Oxalobacteraceae bacterium]